MNFKSSIFAIAFGLILCSNASALLVVDNDDGGRAIIYYNKLKEFSPKETLQFRGKCKSACTLYLAHKGPICVYPFAEFWFHAARDRFSGEYHQKGTMEVMSLYPRRIQEIIRQKGGLTDKWIILKGTELFPLCKA